MSFDCKKCKHFFVTHNQRTPYGCRIFQIQSQTLPALVVRNNSGKRCMGFSAKKERDQKTESSVRKQKNDWRA